MVISSNSNFYFSPLYLRYASHLHFRSKSVFSLFHYYHCSDYRSTAFFIRSAVGKCLLPRLLHFHLSSHLNSRQTGKRREKQTDRKTWRQKDRVNCLCLIWHTSRQCRCQWQDQLEFATNQRARSLQTYEGLPNGIKQSAAGFIHVCLGSALGHQSTKLAHSFCVFCSIFIKRWECSPQLWSGPPGLSALSSFCLSADRLVSAGLCTSRDMSGSDAAKPVATNESLFSVQSH